MTVGRITPRQAVRDACRLAALAAFPVPEGETPAAYVERCAKADAVIWYALGRPITTREVLALEDEHEIARVAQRFEEVAAGTLELVLRANGRFEARRRARPIERSA